MATFGAKLATKIIFEQKTNARNEKATKPPTHVVFATAGARRNREKLLRNDIFTKNVRTA